MPFNKSFVLDDTRRIYEGKNGGRPLPENVLDQTLHNAQVAYDQRGYDFMIVSVRSDMEDLLRDLDMSSTPEEAAPYEAHLALLEALKKLQIQSN